MPDEAPTHPARKGKLFQLPESVDRYLMHVENGVPIRQIARSYGCHASTIQRQIRRVEAMRDDLLFDAAVSGLSSQARGRVGAGGSSSSTKRGPTMNMMTKRVGATTDETELEREARRILRRLSEPGACLAYAADMEKAVVVREAPDGRTVRIAVTERELAQEMALRDWLVCTVPGRVSRYRITTAGRAALKRLLADGEPAEGFSEQASRYADQHRDWREGNFPTGAGATTKMRYNAAESPVAIMARRKSATGEPFLGAELVAAAERLREDFELAQMGPRVTQNWEKFLSGGERGISPAQPGSGGSEAARSRVMAALKDLGPGLGDVALRVCCFLEDMESTEKRLGWSARSGKVVLRIALQRLHRHYQDAGDNSMIG